MSHPVDFFINGCVFFNICVGARQIGLRLVVIVIADEILYGIIGKKGLEFAVKLGCKSLVVSYDKGRSLCFFDDICYGKRLA